jgi:hypothetical protein
MSVPLLVGVRFSNSGVLLAAALLAAALLWPTTLGGGYVLVVVWGIGRWAAGRGTWLRGAAGLAALQAWCGAHLMLLYLAQVGRGLEPWRRRGVLSHQNRIALHCP